MPQTHISSTYSSDTQSFGLEQAEIEMLLTLKQDEGLAFDCAVRSAVCSSGNEILFAFPKDKFEVPAKSVWAVLLHTGSEDACIYVYECGATGDYLVADNDTLNPDYLSFAKAHASIMTCIAKSHRSLQHLH